MKKLVNLLLVLGVFISFSFPFYASAKGGNRESDKEIELDEEVAIDCNFVYNLKETEIQKYSLPDLTLVQTVELPQRTTGEEITIAGSCSDPKQTILVVGKRKGRGGGEVVLSYNTDLQLIATLDVGKEEDDDDDDDDDDEDDDNNDDDDDDDKDND